MAPVAAAISGNASGAMKSKIQSIAWPGPAMKPSSDIDLFTTTLPFPVLISLTPFLRSSSTHDLRPTARRAQGRTSGQREEWWLALIHQAPPHEKGQDAGAGDPLGRRQAPSKGCCRNPQHGPRSP